MPMVERLLVNVLVLPVPCPSRTPFKKMYPVPGDGAWATPQICRAADGGVPPVTAVAPVYRMATFGCTICKRLVVCSVRKLKHCDPATLSPDTIEP
jgi:hypothetical protein